MTVSQAVAAEIRRLYFAEHWKIGTIATQLGVHHSVVRRVLGLLDRRTGQPSLPSGMLSPYLDFIGEQLKLYPRLRSTRLQDMLRERGYTGSVRTLRRHVAHVRPRPKREAYLRLDLLPGEQAQVDWAHVGQLAVSGGLRAVWVFVMVLSYSRAMWAELVLDLSVDSLRRSLVRACRWLGGSSRQWLFDNPRTVVLERHGDAARLHPDLLDVASAYCAQVRLCAVRKANQKGRVERAIRYLRERHFAGRHLVSIEEGNRQLLQFLETIALQRPHPTLPEMTVEQALQQERPRLLPLPVPEPCTDTVRPVAVDKTAFVRFDTNLYSVPCDHVDQTLTLVATDTIVRLLDGDQEVARHTRCWGRRQQVEDLAHRQEILERKRAAHELKGRDRLRAACPAIEQLYLRWIDGERNLGSLTARAVKLLDLYGDALLAQAVEELLARGLQDIGALGQICEQKRRQADQPVPIDVVLGRHVPDRDVIPHDLEDYDG